MPLIRMDVADQGGDPRLRLDIVASGGAWRQTKDMIKELPGTRWDAQRKFWHAPLDLGMCRAVRDAFGSEIEFTEVFKEWAWQEDRSQQALAQRSAGTSADVSALLDMPWDLTVLHDAMRGYQQAGAVFMAESPCPLNADHPGLGKSIQSIAGVYLSGLGAGRKLVVCPSSAVELTWVHELEKWQPQPVLGATGTRAQRELAIMDFMRLTENGDDGWLVINPAMLQLRSEFQACEQHEDSLTKERRACAKEKRGCVEREVYPYEQLVDVEWSAVICDEVHRGDFSLTNPTTKIARGIYALDVQKRFALTGTPMKKSIKDLYGILKWLTAGTVYQGTYSNKWNWFGRYCERVPNRFSTAGFQWGDLRPDKEEALFADLRPYVLRRKKTEVASELPSKMEQRITVSWTDDQRAQYTALQKDGGLVLPCGLPSAADNALTEILRMRQINMGPIDLVGKTIVPKITVDDSPKFAALVEKLTERGAFGDYEDPTEHEQFIVFSQWAEVVGAITNALNEMSPGIAVSITGSVKPEQRRQIGEAFQSGTGPRVLVMTTGAGGVSITLDRADSVHFVDEPWTAADKEQAEDRAHRISRVERTDVPVTIYTYVVENSVDEAVSEVVAGRAQKSDLVMDVRRQRQSRGQEE